MKKDTEALIVTHKNADFDALSSMIAAKKLYPDAELVVPSSQEKSLRNFIMNSLIYSYQFITESEVNLEAVKTLIIVDTRQKSRIGVFSQIIDRVKKIIYDHHPPSSDDIKGDEEHVEEVGANTTIMVEELIKRKIDISPDEASLFLLGIYEDTGKFTYSSTTPRDMRAAAYLLEKGADIDSITPFLSKEMTLEQFNLMSELLSNLERVKIKGFEVGISEARWESYVMDVAPIVQMVFEMHDLSALFCIFQLKDRVFVIGRSRVPEIDASKVCSIFGGGGHRVAASSSIKGIPPAQAKLMLLERLESVTKPKARIKDLMFSPVKCVDANDTIEKAHEIMAKYGINALPVIENGKVAGIITRHVVDRALYHKLSDSPCRTFMEREFVTLSPEDSIEALEELNPPKGQRLIPVVNKKGELIGAVTRTSILSYYKELYKPTAAREVSKRTKDLEHTLSERIPEPLVRHLKEIGELAEEMGYKAYIVGGFVRDLILGIENYDVDVVVEGDGEKLLKELHKRKGYKVTTFSRFKTGSVWFPEGFKVDVATSRLEYYEGPGKLPVVEKSSLVQDLYRRDFSINTLAISLSKESFGKLLDFFGGYRDIKDKVIRVLHNLSFVEDPTRIIRAIRFSLKLDFRIGKTTEFLLKDAVEKGFLKKTEGPRIYKELKLLFSECDIVKSVEVMENYGILRALFQVELTKNLRKILEETRRVISWYSIEKPEETPRKHLLVISGILSVTEKPFDVMEFFKPPKDEEKVISWCLKEAKNVLFELENAVRSSKSPYSLIHKKAKKLPVECLLFLLSISRSRSITEAVKDYVTNRRHWKPELTGKDLINMGYDQGPIIGEILKKLEEAVIDGIVKGKREEIEWVKRNFPKKR